MRRGLLVKRRPDGRDESEETRLFGLRDPQEAARPLQNVWLLEVAKTYRGVQRIYWCRGLYLSGRAPKVQNNIPREAVTLEFHTACVLDDLLSLSTRPSKRPAKQRPKERVEFWEKKWVLITSRGTPVRVRRDGRRSQVRRVPLARRHLRGRETTESTHTHTLCFEGKTTGKGAETNAEPLPRTRRVAATP